MMIPRLLFAVLFGLLLCFFWAGAESLLTLEAAAHRGGLDRCGGHHDRKAGSYHRHRLWGGAECSSESGSEAALTNGAQEAVKEFFGRAERILDGDTFWMVGFGYEGEGLGEGVLRRKVRLWGVDSPELQQGCIAEGEVWRCGEAARAKLRSMLGRGDQVRCVVRGRSYGRLVGRCFVGLEDVGEALVGGGLAVEDTRYSGGSLWRSRGGGSCGGDGNLAGLFYPAAAVACEAARLRRVASSCCGGGVVFVGSRNGRVFS